MGDLDMVRNSTRAWTVALAALLAMAGAACQSAPEVPEGPPVTALTGVRIIDGSGQAPVEGGTILISEDRITAAGADVEVPAGATVVNLDGKTVMPGISTRTAMSSTSATPCRCVTISSGASRCMPITV